MSRYFGDISPKYRVSEGIDTIFLQEISVQRFFGIYRDAEKSAIFLRPAIFRHLSREIGDFSPIYRVVNAGQTRVNESQTRYSASHFACC